MLNQKSSENRSLELAWIHCEQIRNSKLRQFVWSAPPKKQVLLSPSRRSVSKVFDWQVDGSALGRGLVLSTTMSMTKCRLKVQLFPVGSKFQTILKLQWKNRANKKFQQGLVYSLYYFFIATLRKHEQRFVFFVSIFFTTFLRRNSVCLACAIDIDMVDFVRKLLSSQICLDQV